jgi:predicted RNA binding protein with dsRBD fold (UPF0201 family)
MATVEVRAAVNPTEDAEKVKTAAGNMVPLDFEISEDGVLGKGGTDALAKLHTMLRREQILDTARMLMTADLEDNRTSFGFRLNKQAAFAGKASFPAGDSPLGDIRIRVYDDSSAFLGKIIDWLAPPTEDGKPLFEIPMPGK